MSDTYALGDLFCGAGGMALGAVAAMHKHRSCYLRWGLDSDSDSIVTFRKNFELQRHQAICEDVREFNLNELKAIDGLLIGLPNTDFAKVGIRKGTDGKVGKLYKKAAEALKLKKPLFFIMETTARHFQQNRGDYETLKKAFETAGYDVYPKRYHYQHYGLPQDRVRLIMVGFRADLVISNFTHPGPTTEDEADFVTASEALAGIPRGTPNHTVGKLPRRIIERLKHIEPGKKYMNSKIPKKLQMGTSDARLNQLYRRLHPDRIAPLVSVASGGGTGLYHWHFQRALSVRECARLQSFPDEFEFVTVKSGGNNSPTRSQMRQVGQAMPPECAKIITEAVLDRLIEQGVRPKRFWKEMRAGTGVADDVLGSIK